MIDAKKEWQEIELSENEHLDELIEETGFPKIVLQILMERGYDSLEAINNFLDPDARGLYDPNFMHDMELGVDRIQQAIMNGEKIVIYGDYDVDGITSTALMYETLEELGAEVEYYIPDRFKDGYGPNVEAYKRLIDEGVSLIVTVDNGVAGHEAIDYANQHGVDVVITDHHELPETLPDAYAIIHPRHPEGDYPFGELSGVGVAFKVAAALLEELPQDVLDLVALGTVADLVSLTGENRILVKYGLQLLQQTMRPGLQSLYKVAGIEVPTITEETIGFSLAPRLNALGRMENGSLGVELLTTLDGERAEELAKTTNQLNIKRQEEVNKIVEEAVAQLANKSENHLVNVVAGNNWHEGVVGIVASRLVDMTGKPSLVLSIDEKTGIAKGSGRSIEAFQMFDALDSHRDILMKFGGHHMACGLSLDKKKLSDLQQVVDEEGKKQGIEHATKPVVKVIPVNLDDVNLDLEAQLEVLAPFGTDNPRPVFEFKDYKVDTVQAIGQQKNHLKLQLQSNNSQVDALDFGIGSKKISEIEQNKNSVRLIGTLGKNVWQSRVNLQIMIEDILLDDSNTGTVVEIQRKNKLTKSMFQQKATYVFFDKKLYNQVMPYLADSSEAYLYNFSDDKKLNCDTLIVVDCPDNIEKLKSLLSKATVKHFTFVGYTRENTYLNGLPTREQFGRLYKFSQTHTNVNIRRDLQKLADYLKLKRELLVFMINVFFEAKFVKIENGLMSGNTNVTPHSLEDTNSYQAYLQKMKVQKSLIYSKSTDLQKWILKYLDENN
ncbi:single-stranded-DNA-specific exonuclease RecJ [Ligilactobacillus salivarius]|uniref:single-stranded-DNA-specific exonuclease RecJ n=1 Tax=Ligilactobacillus salivarius TaxID=1624 RepID=UPI00195ED8D6|nr:single-stranded-DNA-specific exonuclease RecJ [Ligilactobacillus salivarius]MBM6956221.1 single-stranded-DNA-specific exonuclease RecJ [Ligilactobacillus salivarius]